MSLFSQILGSLFGYFENYTRIFEMVSSLFAVLDGLFFMELYDHSSFHRQTS